MNESPLVGSCRRELLAYTRKGTYVERDRDGKVTSRSEFIYHYCDTCRGYQFTHITTTAVGGLTIKENIFEPLQGMKICQCQQ